MIWGISWVAASAFLGLGQQEPAPVAQFSSGVQLIEVYATVTDAKGELVTGLRQSDFEVFENGRAERISAFAAGEFPLTVAVGVDRSFSMAGEPLRLAKLATQTFLRQLRDEDRSMVVSIGNHAEILAPLSRDRESQARAVGMLDAWSTTALNDSIIAALDHLAPEKGRQALVLFSDGVDRYSTATAADALARARRSQALIYPITIGRARAPAGAELAVLTGGRSFVARDARDLDRTFATIYRELRYQYLLGYAPSEPVRPGLQEWRSIRVTVKGGAGGFRARARDGYVAE